MADEQQVALLKQGPQVWNAWRGNCPEAIVDLSAGALRGMDLTGADLAAALGKGNAPALREMIRQARN